MMPAPVPVTDPGVDAPDGAVLFLADHYGIFVRRPDRWEPVALPPLHPMTILVQVDGEDHLVEVTRCGSRRREGKRSWRCTKTAGHDTHEPVPSLRMHGSLAGGRRWWS
jgi:hypothetical protein